VAGGADVTMGTIGRDGTGAAAQTHMPAGINREENKHHITYYS